LNKIVLNLFAIFGSVSGPQIMLLKNLFRWSFSHPSRLYNVFV